MDSKAGNKVSENQTAQNENGERVDDCSAGNAVVCDYSGNPSKRKYDALTSEKTNGTESDETAHCSHMASNAKRLCTDSKNKSVWNDANEIAQMLNLTDRVQEIYEYVLARSSLANRVEVVMNDLLLNNTDNLNTLTVSTTEPPAENTKPSGRDAEISMNDIFTDVQRILSLVKEHCPSKDLDANQIFALLEANLDHFNRVHYVADLLINQNGSADIASNEGNQEPSNMRQDTNMILKAFPEMDSGDIMLEKYSDVGNQVNALNKLKDTESKSTRNSNEQQSSGGNSDDPLLRDMQTIAEMFPNQDHNEIYAYLEAYHGQSNRVEIVMEELLRIQNESQTNSDITVDLTKETQHEPDSFSADLEMLQTLFPDCDPDYIIGLLNAHKENDNRTEIVSDQLFERKYPKIHDRIEREKVVANKMRLQNLKMEPSKFLEMFPDPKEQFMNENQVVTDKYKEHASIQLKNDFCTLSLPFIDQILLECKHHYGLAHRKLTKAQDEMQKEKKEFSNRHRKDQYQKKNHLLKRSRMHQPLPESPDEYFFYELFFIKKEALIFEYKKKQLEARELKMAFARISGELQTCTCCYNSDILFEDMLSCPDGHIFCPDCIRRSTEVAVGDGKTKFPCLSEDCPTYFTNSILQKVLSSKLFSTVLNRMQEEELQHANIPDLVSCPFCSFSTIMPNQEDKLFRCLNPECLKESCRLCKELNHIPLRCEEVEKSAETKMRVFIEARITESMLRTCWKCNKRFYKTEGCNKMTCTCGAHMCYVCREPIKDYSHFDKGKCSLNEDANQLHVKEMENAAAEAKKLYLEQHPEATSVKLKTDPVKNLIASKSGKKRSRLQ